MSLTNLIIFALFIYGLSNILVYSIGPFHIFEKIREWAKKMPSNLGDLFDCMICMPTWVGMGISALNIFMFSNVYFTPFYSIIQDREQWFVIIILDGIVASGVNWLIHTLQEYLEKNQPNG